MIKPPGDLLSTGPCVQLTFEKLLFPKTLPNENYKKIDRSVREAVLMLHRKNILTNSSEGGGGRNHSAPDYAYIEARLSRDNLDLCSRLNLLLDRIHGGPGRTCLLFNGSALSYGRHTGFHIIGFKRDQLTDSRVKKRFRHLIKRLKFQEI
jgi:hypothetical protein